MLCPLVSKPEIDLNFSRAKDDVGAVVADRVADRSMSYGVVIVAAPTVFDVLDGAASGFHAQGHVSSAAEAD
jgi:hypothetical protein